MKKTKTRELLQLFADGSAAAAAGASTSGDTGVAAGHRSGEAESLSQRAQESGQAAAAVGSEGTPRMTWEQIKADPEFSARMQSMVQQRLKNAKQAQEALQTLTPLLQKLALEHGLDPQNPDYAALSRAVAGQPVPDPMQAHYRSLVQQGEALKQRYPGFDLQKELQDPTFVRLTAPNVGISLEDAYYTVHRKGIEAAALQVAAQQTAQRISNAIRSGTMRPTENGSTANAPSVTAFDYRNASRQQREALKNRIRLAGARGEKIYPGSM